MRKATGLLAPAEILRAPALPADFYARTTVSVAVDLLGAYLVRFVDGEPRIGRIVETEAYLGAHDRACHSARGRTARTEPMYGAPGHAYVYMIYGMYQCINVVTEPPGRAAAVLLRALEPVAGVCGRTDGPGRLCRAMAIDRTLNGSGLACRELRICARGSGAAPDILRRRRIGVDYSGSWSRRLLRFIIRGNEFVSSP